MGAKTKTVGYATSAGTHSRRMLRSSGNVLSKLQLMLDIVIVELSLFLLVYLKGLQDFTLYYYPALIVLVLMWLIYSNAGIYRRFSGKISRALNLLWAWSKVMAILIVWAFITKGSEDFSRQVIISWFFLAALLQFATHIGSNYFIQTYILKSHQTIASILVGNSPLGGHLAKHINNNPWTVHKIVGVISKPKEADEVWHIEGLPRLGNMDELRAMVEKYSIRRVYFALPMDASHQIRDMQLKLIDLNVDIIWAPDIFGLHMINPSVKEVAGVPLYYLSESPMVEGARISKLALDKVVSFIALALFSPIMLMVAVAIKTTSPGPLFFRQERHGMDGKIIRIFKFRSMTLHKEKEGGVTQAKKGDARVTKVGAFIRKTSLDELPQLFNVLKGDMSLVGPRPHAMEHNHYYSDKINAYMSRHRILPGMTGLAQVNGCRGETDTLEKMEKRVEYDLAYINSWSIWLDIRIMIKTVVTLLSKNAY